MATKSKAETANELEVVVFAEAEAMTVKATTDLVATTIGTREHLAQLKATYGELVVNGIEDMAGYKVVVEGISKLKKIRTGIESRRKALTEPALKFQRDLKAVADEITAEIVPLEKRLAEEKARIDDAKETARRAEFQRRVTLLTENAWMLAGGFYVCGALQIHPDQIGTMDEQQLQFYVGEGQKEIQRREAEAQRKADEERQRQEHEEKLRQEREAIAKEREELARLRAELEAQKAGIEKAYETVVQPEQPLPIQDAGVRLQERSAQLLQLGMRRQADGFAIGDRKILHTTLMELSDEDFTRFTNGIVEFIQSQKQAAPTSTFKTPENWKPVANGGGAPLPAQEQPQAQAPVQNEPVEPTWHQQQTETVGFQMGFDNFRMQLVELLSGKEKYTRQQIVEWAMALQPRR